MRKERSPAHERLAIACAFFSPSTSQPRPFALSLSQSARRTPAPARAGTKVDGAHTANVLDFDELTDVIR